MENLRPRPDNMYTNAEVVYPHYRKRLPTAQWIEVIEKDLLKNIQEWNELQAGRDLNKAKQIREWRKKYGESSIHDVQEDIILDLDKRYWLLIEQRERLLKILQQELGLNGGGKKKKTRSSKIARKSARKLSLKKKKRHTKSKKSKK